MIPVFVRLTRTNIFLITLRINVEYIQVNGQAQLSSIYCANDETRRTHDLFVNMFLFFPSWYVCLVRKCGQNFKTLNATFSRRYIILSYV